MLNYAFRCFALLASRKEHYSAVLGQSAVTFFRLLSDILFQGSSLANTDAS